MVSTRPSGHLLEGGEEALSELRREPKWRKRMSLKPPDLNQLGSV
jgi:hypothetical protein